MVIVIFSDGTWSYSWEADASQLLKEHRRVDIDRWYEYDLTTLELQACLGAIDEAENRRCW